MEPKNLTGILELQYLRFSDDPEQQHLFFVLFLIMYLVSVLSNLLNILVISSDSHLHDPSYFFCYNLSLTDIGFSSCTTPNVLVNIQKHNKSITYAGCLTQVFWVFFPFSMFGQSTALCNVL
jgi:olfactory receptor